MAPHEIMFILIYTLTLVCVFIGFHLSVFGYRWMFIGFCLSVIGYRLLTIGFILSVIAYRLLVYRLLGGR